MTQFLIIYLILYILGIILYIKSEIILEYRDNVFTPEERLKVIMVINVFLLITCMMIYYFLTVGADWVKTRYTIYKIKKIVDKIKKKHGI